MDGQIKIGDFGLVTAMVDEDINMKSCDKTNMETAYKKHTREVGKYS